jgi:hypothetical protein
MRRVCEGETRARVATERRDDVRAEEPIQPGDLLAAHDGTVVRIDERHGDAWHVRFLDSPERALIGCVGELGPEHMQQWRKVDLGRWTQADIDEIQRGADEMWERFASPETGVSQPVELD